MGQKTTIEPYVSPRTIRTYLTLRLGGCVDLAIMIDKLYREDFLERSRRWYIAEHNPYIPSTARNRVQTSVGCIDHNYFWKYMNPRLYYLEDIKMIGHADFISKTNKK